MKRWKYVGPPDEADVPALNAVVSVGDVVEVEDPEVSAGLEGQDRWQHVPDPQRSKAAKKAAEARSDDDSQEG